MFLLNPRQLTKYRVAMLLSAIKKKLKTIMPLIYFMAMRAILEFIYSIKLIEGDALVFIDVSVLVSVNVFLFCKGIILRSSLLFI